MGSRLPDFISSDLPEPIRRALYESALQEADSEDPGLLERIYLRKLVELRNLLPQAEAAVVQRVREQPSENTWKVIGELIGTNASAAWQRYGVATTTPDSRKAQSAASQHRVAPSNLPGVTVAEAARQLSMYPDRIRRAIRRSTGEKWFRVYPTQGKRGSTIRVLDLDALARILASDSLE